MDNGVSVEHDSQVPRAQGMVTAQVGGSVDDALVLLTERAQATGLRLEEVALAVVEHRTQFRHARKPAPI